MNWLSLRNDQLKFKTLRELPITLEELMKCTSNLYRKVEGCQHVTGWTCKMLGSRPIMPKNLPDHRLDPTLNTSPKLHL
jgi:hypothetical protein